MKKKYISNSINETKNIAYHFAKDLKGGELVLLNGDLGAGKTLFTKFVAEFLGVQDIVTSPTFTILKEYKGTKLKINHFDMYRLNDYQEAYEFGIEDYLNNDEDEVTIIEWPERIAPLLPDSYIEIKINIIDNNAREIEILNK